MGRTFLEIIFKPVWKWLVSMPLELIGLLTFINPDWGSIINYPSISSNLAWYWLVIIGLTIWGIATAWEATKRLRDKQKDKGETKSITATESGGGNALAFRDNYGVINQGYQQSKSAEVFDIAPITTRNDQWVSVDVPNPLNKAIECYCIWNSIEVDGKAREDIRAYITPHTHRVSWSGGDTNGKEEGVKLIDRLDTLNIVTPTHAGLRFETAKGNRDLDYGMQYGVGTYRIILDLRYRSVGDESFQSKMLEVNFICDIEPTKTIQELMGTSIDYPCGEDSGYPDIIKTQFGVASLTDFLPVRECIYVKIIR